MSIIRRTDANPCALNDEEKSALRSSRMPDEVKRLLPRTLDTMAVDTVAAQKATAYLMSQAQLLRTAREVQSLIDQRDEMEELRRQAAVSRQSAVALEVENRRLGHQIARVAALPALAVNSDD